MKKFLAKVKNSRVVKWCSVGTMTTAFTNIQNNLFSYIAIALPIALAIVGAIFGIKYAIRFFKNIANK